MEDKLRERRRELLVRMAREMHGAVTDYIGYRGDNYGVNYGVALHTVRSIAQTFERNSSFAESIYNDSHRELRLAALWLVSTEEMDVVKLGFWADGLINTEVCEEAAFALFRYVDNASLYLMGRDDRMSQYAGLLTLSYCDAEVIMQSIERVRELSKSDFYPIAKAVVLCIERCAMGGAEYHKRTIELSKNLPQSVNIEYIKEELGWRLEL